MAAELLTIKLTGFAELERELHEFGPKFVKAGLRASARAGANAFLPAVQANAARHTRTGTLLANIYVSQRRTGVETKATYAVRVRPGATKRYVNNAGNRRARRVGKKYQAEGPAYYIRFLEFGTSRMRAYPIFRPAFMANYERAIDAAREALGRALERVKRQSTKLK